MMYGTTFGRSLFETPSGRVEPDSDVHFGVLLIASTSEREGAPRDHVCSMIWPTSPLDHSRHSLRQALYRLRRLGMPISLKGARVEINGEDTYIDIRRLLLGEAGREELMAIGTQPFLPAYMPKLGPAYAVWLDELRDRADNVRRIALVEAIREARTHARFREIHTLARALLELDPFNETATLSLAEALVMDGSKVEALRMLEAYEQEVGTVADALRIPVRTLKRRVSESLDDALLPRKYEVTFVGREEEFRELRTMFVATRQGRGQCAVVTGEAGIGKTRITNELLRLAVLDGAMVVSYPCTSGDSLSPLSSLLTLTQALLSQPGALGCSQEHLQYLRKLHSPESNQSTVISGMGADIAYAQLVYALSELVAAITDEGPVVLFVDDAQRLHQTAWRIFTDIVDRLPGKSVLLLLATRHLPEWYSGLGINGSDGRARHVRLGPLDYAESRRYLSAWCEKNRVMLSEEDSHVFATTASGNPFYLGELAGHVGRGGDARQAPPSIRGLIELQYAATTREAQRVLLVISLLQTRASLARVTEVLGVTPSDFVGALEELEIAGLLGTSGSALKVKHDTIADVTVHLATPGVVRFLRGRIARLLADEAESSANVDLLSDSLTHWEAIGEEQEVVGIAMRLGNRLLATDIARDAATAYTLALRGAKDKETSLLAMDGIVRASWAAGDTLTTLQFIDRRSDLLKADDRRVHNGELELISLEASVSRAKALSSEDRARLELISGEPMETAGRKLMISAIAADLDYRFDDLRRIAIKAKTLASESGSNLPDLLTALLISEASIGGADRTLDLAERLASLARESAEPRSRLLGLRRSATAFGKLGLLKRTIELSEEAETRAAELRLPHHQAICLELVAYSHLDSGKYDHAAEVASRMAEFAKSQKSTALYLHTNAILARLACERSAKNEAESWELWLDENESSFTTRFAYHVFLTIRMTLRQLQGKEVPKGDLDLLLQLHTEARATGRQDFKTGMLARLLVADGQITGAQQIVHDYISSYRREVDKNLDYLMSLLPNSVLNGH